MTTETLTAATRKMGAALDEASREFAKAMTAMTDAFNAIPEDTMAILMAMHGEGEADPADLNAAMESDAWEFEDAARWRA